MPVNITNEDGNTPLHLAAIRGLEPECRALLRAGARGDFKNKIGYTPACFAVANGHAGVVTILAASNALPDVETNGPRWLSLAAGLQRPGCSARLLTALLAARVPMDPLVFHGAFTVEAFEALRAAGAPVDTTDRDGDTALHVLARWKGLGEQIRALVEAGAPLEIRNNAGDTPLMAALKSTQGLGEYNVPLLISLGASTDVRTADGGTLRQRLVGPEFWHREGSGAIPDAGLSPYD